MDLTSINDSQSVLFKACISKQLEEIDLLSSIYCNPNEMTIYDPGVISDFNEYLKGSSIPLRSTLDFAIAISTSRGDKIDIRVELPHLYPVIENAIVTIRNALLSKPQESFVKSQIENYIDSMDKSDTYMFQVISWIQEQIDDFLTKDTSDLELEKKDHHNEIDDFERLWIYSHHIKSRWKRQEIVRQSRDLDLTGFLRPGKPGIICVEGLKKNTQEFWRIIKSMQWHKITIRKSEVRQKAGEKMEKLRRFDGFREELFSDTGDDEGTKISMSQFITFLDKHNSGYIKKELFGFE
ncbi:RWD domain-containing protein 2A [Episyrphus balteatus]|uniref:RWD domain-containing protein 2A n=1 Tax=Episyrphus balteatus TaxID=286459 RepID=UPI002485BA49|nr:RWD domain-containing protein 2A [Episyrphus balteatus]XP_055854735.1 RWD domain-containing protein 2A [Episyrphus balteatus]